MAFWRPWIASAFGPASKPASAPRAAVQSADGGIVIRTSADLEAALRSGIVTASGVAVTPEGSLKDSTAYACIRLIAGIAATLPLDIKRRIDDRTRESASDEPVARLLKRRPNRWQTPSQFKRMMQTHQLMRGAGSALIVRSRGEVRELIPLDPNRLTTEQAADLSLVHIYRRKNGATIKLGQEEVFQLIGLTLDGVHGVTPLTFARETIGEALAQAAHGATIFKNGARVSGALTHPNALGPETIEKLKAELDQFRAEGERDGKVMILEEGMEFKPLALTSVDAQWIESRAFTRSDIAMFFGVPPSLIGIANDTSVAVKSFEQQSSGFVAYTQEDYLTMWEEAIARDLLDDENLYARFNRAALVKGDLTARWAAYVKALQWGVNSPNEIRALEDQNPREGGDVFYPPPNMTAPDVKGEDATNEENADEPPQAA